MVDYFGSDLKKKGGYCMRTIEEKLKVIAELKKRVNKFLEQKPEPEYIDLMEILEEPETPYLGEVYEV